VARSANGGGYIAVLAVELWFADVSSLKGKRRELAPVKTWLRGRGATVAETGYHDKWQRAALTVAFAGGSVATLDEALDSVERWLLARFPDGGVRAERFIASVEDLRA
jgi:uncharacterized protein YlxP (DUF503 family)